MIGAALNLRLDGGCQFLPDIGRSRESCLGRSDLPAEAAELQLVRTGGAACLAYLDRKSVV